MSFVAHLLFNNTYTPPPEVGVRRHRIMQDPGKATIKEPVQARSKIYAVLHKFDYKTLYEIAADTGLNLSTVARTTDRMYAAGKIERSKRIHPSHGRINIYRKK